jgi:hypothetical protein
MTPDPTPDSTGRLTLISPICPIGPISLICPIRPNARRRTPNAHHRTLNAQAAASGIKIFDCEQIEIRKLLAEPEGH